jgi:hypothetical protein
MTVVLTVMSNMDPDTIRETWVGMDGSWESVSQSCVLGQTTTVDSMVGSMSHFEEKSF